MRKNLTTREARRRLKRQHAPHWARVHRGLMLGWRRHTTPSGTWYVRWLADDGKYHQDRLGVADDKAEADGEHFLTYQQALERALKLDRSADGQDKPSAHYTVWDACQNWLDDYKGRSSPAGSRCCPSASRRPRATAGRTLHPTRMASRRSSSWRRAGR